MRHAKSSWKHPDPDYKRGLKKRGWNDARLVSEELKRVSLIPEIIISSCAERAKLTAEIVKSELDDIRDIPLITEKSLYETDVRDYLNVIRNIDDKYDSVMIVAHNPTISDTAVLLSSDSAFEWMPTSAVAVMDCDTESWKNLQERKCKIKQYITPKLLKSSKKK